MENVAPEKVAYVTKFAEEKDKTVEVDRLPPPNDEIHGDLKKFKLKEVLGAGGFGTVFLSLDGEKLVAVKTEKYGKLRLHVEVEKAANAAKAKHFCDLIDYGSKEPNYVYMVMTVLHKDLHSLRCEMPKTRFGINTSLRPSMESLKDLGRRDGLESWVYTIVEMARGKPSWAPCQAKSSATVLLVLFEEDKHNVLLGAVCAAKETARASGRMQFLYETPKHFDRILTMVDSYLFESQPECYKIYKILERVRFLAYRIYTFYSKFW